MTDDVTDKQIVTENVAECPISTKDTVAEACNPTSQEADSFINPTITNSTTEAIPKPDPPTTIPVNGEAISTQQQIESRVNSQHVETLQLQIRLFKTLSQRYLDSTIPKLLDVNNRPVVPPALLPAPVASKVPVNLPKQNTESIILPPPPVKQNPIPQPIPTPVILPKPVPVHPTNFTTTAIQNVVTQNQVQPRPVQISQSTGPTTIPQKSALEQKYTELKSAEPVVAAPPAIPLSWQCFSSLMFIGPMRPADGMISIAPSDVGCFSKSSSLPLVLSHPYASAVREKLFSNCIKEQKEAVTSSSSAVSSKSPEEKQQDDELACWLLQRQARASLIDCYVKNETDAQALEAEKAAATKNGKVAVKALEGYHGVHPALMYGPGGLSSCIAPRKTFTRNRRQAKRETRIWEKEERRRRTEIEDKKKRKALEYFKALLAHRDEFFRFHKNKRIESSRAARGVRSWTENADVRKEKMESRAEVKRLQALKENDMEAYAKLVQETKNDRLHFLLNQTDTYLATINRMVQSQRDEADLEDAEEKAGIVRELKEIKVAKEKETKLLNGAATNGGVSGGSVGANVGATGSNGHFSAPSSSTPTATSTSTSTTYSTGTSISSAGMTALKKEGVSAASIMGTETMTKGSKDYYENTHKRNERVSQPQMLRGGDLKEYQLGGLQWMVSLYNNNLNGILADEMGLGKTIQAIALLAYVMEFKHNNGPFLIVVPLSTLSNWVNELSKWAPDMMKVVYKGTPPVRKQMYRDEVEGGQFNVLLTTYEYIMKDKAQLKKFHWQYIIVDEGHRMKNAQSKFAQTLGSVYQSRHRVLLTGTPLQNNLPELWALLNFLLPTIFSSVDTFDQWFNKPFAAFRNQPNNTGGGSATEEAEGEVASLSQEEQLLIVHRLHEVLRPFVLRRVKDQVLDQLPEKTERVLRCDLSGWQRKLYKAIHTKSIASRDKNGEDCSAGGLNNAVMQLRKVCNHPYLFLNDYYVDEDMVRSSGKFELLDRMLPKLKAAGHRVLMFSQMTQVMTILEAFFAMRGLSCLRLDGSTTSDEREKRMYMFNDPDSPYFIFLLSTRAGGLGLNLATADTVVLFDSDWNPMMDAQAQDRAHRIGQKNEVRVFRLVTTSLVEERILARATDKRNLNGLVVEAGKFNNKAAGVNDESESNKAMVENLLKEWTAGGGATEGGEGVEEGEVEEEVEAEVPDDDQINEMMSTHDSELLIYQQMDRERRIFKEKQWADWMKRQPKGTPKTPMPPALMGALEKPLWLQASSWSHKHSQLDSIMMGDGDGTFVPQKKGAKSKKRKADGLDDDDDEDEDDEEDEDGVIVAGKLMRRRKEGVSYDDHMTDKQFLRHVEKVQDQEDAQEVKEKLDKKPVAPMVPKVRKVEMSHDLTDAIMKVVKKITKLTRPEDGGLRAALFLEKPDRKIYPDYYMIVPRPTSFKDITTKLKKGLYATIEDVETEFALMAHNARMFNLDSSPVFADCESLREEFHIKTNKIREEFDLPSPPPFVVDVNQPVAAPVLLDDYGVNIAIFVPPGVRPPLPERTRGYIIYNNTAGARSSSSSSSARTSTPSNNAHSDQAESRSNVHSSSSSSSSSTHQQAHSQGQGPRQGSGASKTTPSEPAIKKRPGPRPRQSMSSESLDDLDPPFSPERKKGRREGTAPGKEEKLFLSLFIPKKANGADGTDSVSGSSTGDRERDRGDRDRGDRERDRGERDRDRGDSRGQSQSQGQGGDDRGSRIPPRGSKVKLKGMGRWPV